MLVSRSFLEDIGLIDESYFLYYEEMDWALWGRGRYRLAYADDAVVYHNEGEPLRLSWEEAWDSSWALFGAIIQGGRKR
jgi:GT2 family glycosyltransferase